jgi:hypothetical protein
MRTHVGRGIALAAAVTLALVASAIAAEDKKAAKTEKKPPSACVGLDINACGTKSECYWKQQITTKNGKTRKAHCRKRPSNRSPRKPLERSGL